VIVKTRTMPEVDMHLEPSWLLFTLLLIFALAGLAVIAIYIADWRVQLALAALLLATTAYHVLRDGLRMLPNAWKQVRISAQGELRLTNKTGQKYYPKLAGGSWVHPWLTVLHFEKSADDAFWQPGLPPLILLAETDADICRRLRVWLRWWRHPDASQADSSDLAT